jgi:hypothetical protein
MNTKWHEPKQHRAFETNCFVVKNKNRRKQNIIEIIEITPNNHLLKEVFAMMEILVATGKQRFQLLSMYKQQCPPELEEAWHTIVFAATRTEIPEFRELTNQLMLLYGEEWGRLANVDAHGLANQRIVRKLTIFANDTLVKQYLQDVMGPDFDPEICFASASALVIGDDADDAHTPQNAAQMERELAALRAAASATAPLSATATKAAAAAAALPEDPFPSDEADAQFRPVEDDDSDDDDNNGGTAAPAAFPDPPADLSSGVSLPPVTPPQHKTAPPVVVPTPPPTSPPTMTVDAQNNLLIDQEKLATTTTAAAESAANDLLARFEALKPKRSNNSQPSTPTPVAPPSAPPPEEDSATLDLLKSFPIVSSSGDVQPPATDDETTGGGDDSPMLPSVPGDDDDDDVGGLHLPRAPTSDLGRGIKSGSKEEKQLDELDDLAARFERLKKGGR